MQGRKPFYFVHRSQQADGRRLTGGDLQGLTQADGRGVQRVGPLGRAGETPGGFPRPGRTLHGCYP